MTDPVYVCMPGQSYTGSTLLGFALNAHGECASIGAASGPIPGIDMATYPCSCGRPLVSCPFWVDVAARMARDGHPLALDQIPWASSYLAFGHRAVTAGLTRSLRNDHLNRMRDAVSFRLPPVDRRMREVTATNVALARAVTDRLGARVFVDTSRDPLRPHFLTRWSDVEVRVVHLVRDARGNVASIRRHKPGVDTDSASRMWWRANTEALRMRQVVPPERWFTLRYHELCDEPDRTWRELCTFLGVAPTDFPDDFREGEHHIIGNEMRLGGDGRLRADERWRTELDDTDLAAIAHRCGALQHELGFPWP